MARTVTATKHTEDVGFCIEIDDVFGRTLIDWKNEKNVTLHGIETHGVELIAVNSTCIVVKERGYTYNPGSRYSMLKEYAPTQMSTWIIGERLSETSAWCYQMIQWNTRK